MERLPEGQSGQNHSPKERLAIKSLPLLSILVDSPQAVSDIQNGHVARAVAGSVFAAGIGFVGSHLILNDGPKLKESWQGIKDWGHSKADTLKHYFPSRKRTLIAGTVATLGLLTMGDGTVQALQGDFSEAANAAATGIGLEGVAGLNILQPHLKRKREYEMSVLGGAVSRQTDLVGQLSDAVNERREIITAITGISQEAEQGLELQASQTVFLDVPEANP